MDSVITNDQKQVSINLSSMLRRADNFVYFDAFELDTFIGQLQSIRKQMLPAVTGKVPLIYKRKR